MDWYGERVLITGGCGFIGSHLVELLQSLGAQVRIFARYTSSGSLGNLSFLSNKDIEIVYGDLRNPYTVRKAMEDIDIVFHLAALISIPYSYYNPSEYFDVNVRSIINILESARDLSTELVLNTSTSEVYGTAKYVPIDEKHPLQGQSPYSASKIAADKVAESFNISFDSPVITLRPFNTFGPRQSTRAIIPVIIKQLLNDSDLFLGDLTPTRDLIYVKDTINGFVKAAEHSKKLIGETVNIGTGKEISMKNLAETISQIMNIQPTFQTDDLKIRPSRSEVRRLCCDASRFMSITDWKPKYTLEEGLKETITFYREFGDQFYKRREFF